MQFFPFGIENETATGSVEELGGKGAGLLWLSNQGVSVPPGFVIPTSVWAEYDKKPKSTMKLIAKALPAYLAKLEAHFGYMPLLSVRSGARVSCPGMMDTILNVGIDGSNMPEWVNRLGPKCFADSFHRLVTMYGSVVEGIRRESLESSLKVALDTYSTRTGNEFPDAKAQLLGAIEAVFKSWDNERADIYRKDFGYDRAWGTACTVQAMVFGNLNDNSGSGVLFTRNPDTGGMLVTGEFLPNAQGEDIVAGIRTPKPLAAMAEWNSTVHDTLLKTVIELENLKKDMLDIEFTVQDGVLYLLQVRSGKRSAPAAVKIAVDMEKQGLIDAKTAVSRVSARQFDLAQLASIDPKFTKPASFTGIPGCSGIVSGKPVFSKEDAINCKEPCILVTHETTPEDIAGMKKAKGIITMVGGMTSHAAVVARGMDRACVVGVGATLESFKDADVVTLDGATGRIWMEAVPIVSGQTNGVIKDFNALVTQTLGVVPIIFDVPTTPMPEALLYLGDTMMNPEEAAKKVLLTLTYVSKLYLDLVPSAEEARFLSLVDAFSPIERLLNLLHAALPKEHDLFSRLVVISESKYHLSFARITPGADLRSLVLSDKELILDGVDLTDPAISRVLSWKQAEGASVVSIGTYVPQAKSMLSIPMALQVLKGVS
jgi:pyruvate,orthophosphate dikinase